MEIQIDTLVKAVPDIERFSLNFKRFCPFAVLKISEAEIRHSNVLAWLLNPIESHGYRDKFINALLRNILTSSENENDEGKTDREALLHTVVLGEFSDAIVLREKDHIDILIISESNKLVVNIENKIRSKEHGNQLTRYLQSVESQYSDYNILSIYLSLNGNKPTNNNYYVASYMDVLMSIDHIVNFDSSTNRTDSQIFLEHYVELIKEKIMSDGKLKQVAARIYRENRQAIDYIYSIGNSIDLAQASDLFLKKYSDVVNISLSSAGFVFVTQGMNTSLKSGSSWGGGNHVVLWFAPYNKDSLKLVLEVGPFDDGKRRLEFLLHLKKSKLKIRDSSLKETGTYTRLWSKAVKIKDWTNVDEIQDVMSKLYEKSDLQSILRKVDIAVSTFPFFSSLTD